MKILGDQFELNPWQLLARRYLRIKGIPPATQQPETEQDKHAVLAVTADNNFAMFYMPDNSEVRFDGSFLLNLNCDPTSPDYTKWVTTWRNPRDGTTPQVAGTCQNIADATGATRRLVRPACSAPNVGNVGDCDWVVILRRAGTFGALGAGASSLDVSPELAGNGSGWRIVGTRKDALGQPVGDPFAISEPVATGRRVKLPAQAADGIGNFVVVWESEDDGDLHGIFLRRVDGQGRLLDHEYRVNSTTAYDQTNPWVSMNVAGKGGVVSWTSYGQDGDLGGVVARLLTSSGVPFGREIPVNETTLGRQDFSKVVITADGGFAVAWTSTAQGAAAEDVYVRRFDPKGNPMGREVRANSTTVGAQWLTNLDVAADGGFSVFWTSYSTEDAELGIWQRNYDANGDALGGEVVAIAATEQ
jgi:hypothetical protein